MRRGFSLVELSIVLVILGLLVGGILAGQSLIRAAELRAVANEYNRFRTASYAFRERYFAWPGDFADATRVWGFAGTTAAPACVSNSGITAVSVPGTCDGNGNGWINSDAANASSDRFQLWKQLALAGLIEGSYSGLAGTISGTDVTIGTNIPASRISRAGWFIMSNTTPLTGNSVFFDDMYGNYLQFGLKATTDNAGSAFLPAEAWNIDSKIDDGRPGRGIMKIRNYNGCATATQSDQLDAPYNLTNNTIACGLVFPRFLAN